MCGIVSVVEREHRPIIVGYAKDTVNDKDNGCYVGAVILHREPCNYHLEILRYSDDRTVFFENGYIMGGSIILDGLSYMDYKDIPVYDLQLNALTDSPFMIGVMGKNAYYLQRGAIKSVAVGGWFEDIVLGECCNSDYRFWRVEECSFGDRIQRG